VAGKRFWTWLTGARAKPLRDIGSIVLGVLIALGIGEIADDVRWRFKVQGSETAMRAELGAIRRVLNERIAAHDCIERRLTAIGAILQEARRGRAVPPLSNLAAPPYRLIENTAFEVARDEGVSLHMPRERWRMYAAAYDIVSGMYGSFADPERARWDTLRLLEAPGSIDSDLSAVLLVAWTEAQAYARRQHALAIQSDRAIATLDIPIDWAFDASANDPRSTAEQKARYAQGPMCKPLTK
jgi:hypothetical protein